MYSYALLEKNCYYLIQETADSSVSLIKVNLETEQCMYVSRYADEQANEWKKKEIRFLTYLNLSVMIKSRTGNLFITTIRVPIIMRKTKTNNALR